MSTAVDTQRGSFAADVLKLATGTASAQVISVLGAPVIAHLYHPAAIGEAALFVAITGVISAIVGMRYELSIVLPERDEEAANAMAVSLCFIVLISTLTLGFVSVFGSMLLRLLHAPQLGRLLWLAPIAVLLNGLVAALNYWATRKKQFGSFTVAQFVSSAFFVIAQIIFGLAGQGTQKTIILTTIAASAVTILVLSITSLRQLTRIFVQSVRWEPMFVALKRYSRFPKYSSGSAILSNVSAQLPTFFLSAFFTSTVVGYYSMGNRLLRIPVNLIGTNVATVFFQRVAEARLSGTVTQSVERVYQYLANLMVFPCLLLCIVGKDLFVVFLGSQWAEAGVYSQLLSPWLLFMFTSVPLGSALSVLEKQALELRLVFLILITRVLSLVVGGGLGDARLTLALFSFSGALVYAYYCAVVLRQCGIPAGRIVRVLADNLGKFIPAGVILLSLKYFDASMEIVVAVAGLLTILYYVNLVRTDNTVRELISGVATRFAPLRANS